MRRKFSRRHMDKYASMWGKDNDVWQQMAGQYPEIVKRKQDITVKSMMSRVKFNIDTSLHNLMEYGYPQVLQEIERHYSLYDVYDIEPSLFYDWPSQDTVLGFRVRMFHE